MYKKLDDYLLQIGTHLPDHQGREEILAEIRSQILEKTQEEFGDVSEEALESVINNYGEPKKVADRYVKGFHMIAPGYMKFLMPYAWLLFACHLGLMLPAYIFGFHINFLWLFSIPYMKNFLAFLNQVPLTLIYDFGLVAFSLFLLTQYKEDVRLPWPPMFKKDWKKKTYEPEPPKWYFLLLMLIGYGAALYLLLTYGTLFFKTINFKRIEPLILGEASGIFSWALLIFFTIELLFYISRFIKQSFLVELIKNIFLLSALWYTSNIPVEGKLNRISIIDLWELRTGILLIISVIIAIETLGIIYKLVRNQISKGSIANK